MSEKENEQEAVRTTIVGGRPPGSGRNNVTVPRGIEVLLKKAAVDPDFRQTLLERRGSSAASIELQLDPAEDAMLRAIPDEQLARIISQTVVPVEQRRVFLGRVAAAMLAAIGAGLAGCKSGESDSDINVGATKGIRPERPSTDGIRPDRPGTTSTNTPAPIPTATQGVRPDRP